MTNAHHEPINFFGTSRPEGETSLLPSTWHENGLEIFGSFGKGYASFDYQAMVVAGLNPNGFDRNTWVGSGKQGIFEEDNFTSPAYVFRLDYKGVPGLRVGASFYYCADAGANSDKEQTYANYGKIPIRIFTADAQYRNKYVTARGNICLLYTSQLSWQIPTCSEATTTIVLLPARDITSAKITWHGESWFRQTSNGLWNM